MKNGGGGDVLPGGYFAYGNDGNHFNDDVNGGGFNTAVGLTIATALKNASDHLPVVCTVQVASKIAAASQLDFGPVIIGGPGSQTLTVTNSATAPADDLDYSLTAPAGFSAPGGSFSALLAGPGRRHPPRSDAARARKDTPYEATLPFRTSAEPQPGAAAAADLVIHLVARPKLGNVGVPTGLPTALRFYAPRPNPLSRGTRFAFDLPQDAPVSLELFDVNGSRV